MIDAVNGNGSKPMKKRAKDKSKILKCSCPSGCGGGIERRDFLKFVALGAAAGVASGLPVMAGPFEASDFEKLVPADKKLDPAWVKSLFARGEKTVYRGAELEKIGMPIGGICAGQLYLGGDGKLWHWDIFNQHVFTGDEHYAQPPKPDFPLEQGFGVADYGSSGRPSFAHWITPASPTSASAASIRSPRSSTAMPGRPLAVTLEAFSPFVPLRTDESSLPATIMRFTVKNTGQASSHGRSRWLAAKCRLPAQREMRPTANGSNRTLREAGALVPRMRRDRRRTAEGQRPRGRTSSSRISRKKPTRAGK